MRPDYTPTNEVDAITWMEPMSGGILRRLGVNRDDPDADDIRQAFRLGVLDAFRRKWPLVGGAFEPCAWWAGFGAAGNEKRNRCKQKLHQHYSNGRIKAGSYVVELDETVEKYLSAEAVGTTVLEKKQAAAAINAAVNARRSRDEARIIRGMMAGMPSRGIEAVGRHGQRRQLIRARLVERLKLELADAVS